VLGRQYHASQQLVRIRSMRNPNTVIEETATFGERHRGLRGSLWRIMAFISSFGLVLVIYTSINIVLGRSAWDHIPSSCSICFFPCSRRYRRR